MPSAQNTKTTIINLALIAIKQRTIVSPSEQSTQSIVANQLYDISRRAALRGCDWNWARVTTAVPTTPPAAPAPGQLNLLGSQTEAQQNPGVASKQDVEPQWNFLYAVPPKCIRVRKVFNPRVPATAFPFATAYPFDNDETRRVDENGRMNDFIITRSPVTNVEAIATNLDAAIATFTKDITDASQFDDMFVEAFAAMLASKMAMPLTADKELAQMAMAEYERIIGEAQRKNGGEGTERSPRGSNYEKSRGY